MNNIYPDRHCTGVDSYMHTISWVMRHFPETSVIGIWTNHSLPASSWHNSEFWPILVGLLYPYKFIILPPPFSLWISLIGVISNRLDLWARRVLSITITTTRPLWLWCRITNNWHNQMEKQDWTGVEEMMLFICVCVWKGSLNDKWTI